jgi:terpene synthase-like protein
MLFGMGMSMTKEEDEQLADVVYPCYAALGLANDYFSFDREYEQFKQSDATLLTNAVWHYMQWQNVDVDTAKDLVRNATTKYEEQFLERCTDFRHTHVPVSSKLDLYLTGLQHQISGNVVWSLNCPRYHPQFRYDPNAGIEDILMAQYQGADSKIPTHKASEYILTINNQSRTLSEPSTDSETGDESSDGSRRSSATSVASCLSIAEAESPDPPLHLRSKLTSKVSSFCTIDYGL